MCYLLVFGNGCLVCVVPVGYWCRAARVIVVSLTLLHPVFNYVNMLCGWRNSFDVNKQLSAYLILSLYFSNLSLLEADK